MIGHAMKMFLLGIAVAIAATLLLFASVDALADPGVPTIEEHVTVDGTVEIVPEAAAQVRWDVYRTMLREALRREIEYQEHPELREQARKRWEGEMNRLSQEILQGKGTP